MTIASQVQNVNNYMVPAAGQTHAVTIAGVFSATPYAVDWRQFHLDNFPFIPQGVFIDNTHGTAALVISIQPIGYNVVCPAGTAIQAQFPAPSGQTCSITGDGQASCFFVDFPVLPSGQNVNINGTANVNITGATNAASPVYVTPGPNSEGVPYQSVILPDSMTAEYLVTSGALVSATPPSNSNLRRAQLFVPGNATLAVAGNDLVTVKLDGTTIFKVSPYIPATLAGTEQIFNLDFGNVAPNTGVAGTLTLQAATALTAGQFEFNAYFD